MEIRFNIKNKNNGAYYLIDENSVYTDNYNETLDSYSLHLSQLEKEIDIEPCDQCLVQYVIKVMVAGHEQDFIVKEKHYIVESYVLNQDTIGIDNKSYSYEIVLCSETKLLEGVILPNLSITPLRTGQKRSIWYYLRLYLYLYGRKIRVENEGNITFEPLWEYDESVEEKFDSIIAPELQWNAPTLREVLNDLMMIGDCIVKMEDNTIGFIDLTETKDPITNFNYLQKSQSIEDYVSEIKMNMQNVLQTQIEGVGNVSTTTEYLTFTSDGYSITTENVELKTTYPILNIKKFSVCVFSVDQYESDPKVYIDEADMTEYIKEYQEYITLPIKYTTGLVPDLTDAYLYANFNVYFNRGSNIITGFSNLTKKISWLPATEQTFDFLKEIAKEKIKNNLGHRKTIVNDNARNLHLSIFFKIEYETMADQVFSASKEDAKNKRVIVDNQTNSWVDAYNQGNMEYQKAKRLGNQQIMFNQRINLQDRISMFDNVIKIGDYYQDGDDKIVIYQVQYQISSYHLEVNAFGTKDYILRNYFTGINSKIRTWVNAKDEAFIRHELEKYYCRASYIQHSEVETYNDQLAYMIGESFIHNGSYAHPIKYGAIRTSLINGGSQPSNFNYRYLTECITRLMGRSLVFTIGFNDNYEAGQRIASLTTNDINPAVYGGQDDFEIREPYVKYEATRDIGGLKTQPIKYVDDNGEFLSLFVKLFRDLKTNQANTNLLDSSQQQQFFVDMYKRPMIEDSVIGGYSEISGVKYTKQKQYYKDNKEIFKLSIQFELMNSRKEKEIYTTKWFLRYNPAIMNEGDDLLTPKVLVDDNYVYEKDTMESNYTDITNTSTILYIGADSTYSSAHYRIFFDPSYLTKKGLYLTDNDNNILIAFDMSKGEVIGSNQRAQIDFYINVLRDPDLSKYSSSKNKIGEI